MHVLNQVQCVDVETGKPVEHRVIFADYLVVIQIFRGDRRVLRADLHVIALLVEELLVLAAVDRVQQRLGEVCAGTEELHFLAGLCRGNAAADAVVVSPDRPHHVIIFILDGGGRHGNVCRIAAEILRQPL